MTVCDDIACMNTLMELRPTTIQTLVYIVTRTNKTPGLRSGEHAGQSTPGMSEPCVGRGSGGRWRRGVSGGNEALQSSLLPVCRRNAHDLRLPNANLMIQPFAGGLIS